MGTTTINNNKTGLRLSTMSGEAHTAVSCGPRALTPILRFFINGVIARRIDSQSESTDEAIFRSRDDCQKTGSPLLEIASSAWGPPRNDLVRLCLGYLSPWRRSSHFLSEVIARRIDSQSESTDEAIFWSGDDCQKTGSPLLEIASSAWGPPRNDTVYKKS